MYHPFNQTQGYAKMAASLPAPVETQDTYPAEKVIYTYVFNVAGNNYVAAQKAEGPPSVDHEVITCDMLQDALDLCEDHFWNLENMGITGKVYLQTKSMMLACNPLVIGLTLAQLDVLTSSVLLEKPRYALFNPVLFPDIYILKLAGDPSFFVVADLMERFEEVVRRREKKGTNGCQSFDARIRKPVLRHGFRPDYKN